MLLPRRWSAAAVLLASSVIVVPASAQSRPGAKPGGQPFPAAIDTFVEDVMQAFEVPGLALAVVKDGKVLIATGYGVRRLGASEPVDARTLFGIASNTKVFTAVALGLLVEEKKIGWEDPVIRHLPWFQMWDPYVTRELTIRDLLVHRSGLGLGAGDLLWWPPSTYNRQEIARRLRHLPPATSFRSAYAYDNVLYLIAGEVIEAVSGQSWEDFVSTRILAKVGMHGSNVAHSAAGHGGNVATTHARVDGVVRPVAPFDSDNTNPAGGINSSAEDMARWMNVLLARGQLPDGTHLFTERTWREITTVVTPMPNPDPPGELSAMRSGFRGYALGLEARDYRGRKILTHTGGLPGYLSKVTTVPDLQLGVAVLTNQESGETFNAITFRILDEFMEAGDTDWLSAYKAVATRAEARQADAERKQEKGRAAGSRPSLPLERYAGVYRDAWYGDIAIDLDGGRPVMRFTKTPLLVGDIEHWQYETFVVRWRDRELRADAFVTFALDPDGNIEHAKMRAVSPATDFSFDFHDLLLRPAGRN